MNTFSVQWHITVNCDQKCKFCYMYDSPTFESERKNQIDYVKFKKIFHNFLKFCKTMGVKPKFVFSGGDPLLHPEFIRFCEYLKKHKMKFSILGNPYHLTNDLIIKLKKLGLTEYQMSIDGLKETHDYFRKKGSFDITIKKFRLLKKHNIITKCMFTLSKKNMKELVPVMKFISGKVDYFSFARMVPIGNGINLKSELITPKSYKKLLNDVYELKQKLKSKTKYTNKDHLWKLFLYEKGLLTLPEDNLVHDGCQAGISHLSILSDGAVLLCRRLPIILGNALKKSFVELFFSKPMIKFRQIEKRKKCKDCELLNICRGCPAVGFALTKNMFAKDPQCWK